MVHITEYLDSKLVQFLSPSSRDAAIKTLVTLAAKEGKIEDPDAFFLSTIDRENIVSTGVGMGVAIPHAKLSSFDDFFIVIGIIKEGIEWNSLDGSLVRIIFLIGGPDDKQTEYLQLLSALTAAIKDEERRKKILTLNSSNAIIQLFVQQ